MNWMRLLSMSMLVISITGCSTTRPYSLTFDSLDGQRIFVVGHGWHTGLVLESEHIDAEAWPERSQLQQFKYVEIGWGDAGVYQAKSLSLPLLLDAALLPSKSVMHVVGFDEPIRKFFPVSDIVEVNLNPEQHANLCRSISSSFERDAEQRVIGLGPGLYGDSQFFEARGLYYFPKTCNVWTATQLHAAGCPVVLPSLASTAGGVLTRARRIGRNVQTAPSGLMWAALFGE